ncbi:MAG: putative secreted protein [Zhongshania sp.]|jgi:predicted secreted protein
MKSSKAFMIEQLFFNSVISAGITFYLGRRALAGIANIPLQAPADAPFAPNMAGDLIVGTFITAVIVSLIVSLLTRLSIKKQSISMDSSFAASPRWLAKLPQNIVLSALSIAGLASLTLGVMSVLLLVMLGVSEADAELYNYLHAIYVGLVVIVVAYAAVTKVFLSETEGGRNNTLS